MRAFLASLLADAWYWLGELLRSIVSVVIGLLRLGVFAMLLMALYQQLSLGPFVLATLSVLVALVLATGSDEPVEETWQVRRSPNGGRWVEAYRVDDIPPEVYNPPAPSPRWEPEQPADGRRTTHPNNRNPRP